jgi:uncharacterized cupredoxin-like copper-binding protein
MEEGRTALPISGPVGHAPSDGRQRPDAPRERRPQRKVVGVKRTRQTTGTRGRVIGAVLTTALLGIAVVTAGTAAAAAKATPVAVDVGDTTGTKGPMTMTVTPSSAPAGKVKFTVTNSGTVIHEFVILKTKVPFDKIPVVKNRVSEAKSVGEIGSIGKGKTKSKTFKLKAGKYVLVCNIAKHYALGMRAAFKVT